MSSGARRGAPIGPLSCLILHILLDLATCQYDATTTPGLAAPVAAAPVAAPVAALVASSGTQIVACLGNSITHGGSVAASATYPAQLQTILGANYKVLNLGIPYSGHSSMQFPYSNLTDWTPVSQSRANIVILQLGTFDSHLNKGAPFAGKMFRKDYTQLLVKLSALKPKPAIVMVIPPPAYKSILGVDADHINDVLPGEVKQVYDKRDLGSPLVDLFGPMGGSALTHSDWFPDGIHCNRAGYKEMASQIWAGLAVMHPSLKKTTPPPGVSTTTAFNAVGVIANMSNNVSKQVSKQVTNFTVSLAHGIQWEAGQAQKFTMSNWQRLLLFFIIFLVVLFPCCAWSQSLAMQPRETAPYWMSAGQAPSTTVRYMPMQKPFYTDTQMQRPLYTDARAYSGTRTYLVTR